MRDRRVRHHAVTKIENERPFAETPRGSHRSARSSAVTSGQERQRIEIALNWPPLLHVIARKRSSTIQSSPTASTGTASRYRSSPVPAPRGKPMIFASGTCLRTAATIRAHRLDTPFSEFIGRQNSRPGIENLHRINASLKLADQISSPTPRPAFDELRKRLRITDRQTTAREADPPFHAPQSCKSPTVHGAPQNPNNATAGGSSCFTRAIVS